jgi:hypothetical protein
LLRKEYDIERSEYTVASWFKAGGRLEQSYVELLGFIAESQLTEARAVLKMATSRAVNRLTKLVDSADENVAFRASSKIVDKHIADPKVTVGIEADDSREFTPPISEDLKEAIERQKQIYEAGVAALAVKEQA